jgi:two-component system response regulator MprA
MPRILAVDPDPGQLAVYKETFAKAGFEVRAAGDALAAVAEFGAFVPDLLVMDAGMPAGGGQTVFDRLRRLFRTAVPVIFAAASAEEGRGLPRLANSAVILKPAAPGALLAEAKRLLRLP